MRKRVTTAAALLSVLPFSFAYAADGIPVVDRSGTQPQKTTAPGTTVMQAVPPVSATPSNVPNNPAKPVMSGQAAATAELLMMLDQLQEEVRYLRGQVEQQQHQIKRMQTDQRDRYRDLDRRLSLLNQRAAPSLPSALPAPLPSATSLPAAAASVAGPTAIVSPSPSITDSQAFKQAFALVREGQFDAALEAFAGFQQNYPDSPLLANVLYWTGEVHRAKPSPDQVQAASAYQQVAERFPEHPKAADSLYKLGLSYQAQGQSEQARTTMGKVLERYADQAAAKLAQDFLRQQR